METIVNEAIRVEQILDCPFCKKEGSLLYDGLRDRFFGISGLWSFWYCKGCEFIWLNPRPVREDLQKLYEYYYTSVGSKSPQTSSLRLRIKVAILNMKDVNCKSRSPLIWLIKALDLIPPIHERTKLWVMGLNHRKNGRLLDVGCGKGGFLALMNLFGWEVLGIEMDANAASFAKKQGVNVIIGTFEEIPLPENHFDAITLSHVIEHAYQYHEFLKKCFRLIKPGGKLVMLTPNANSFGHRFFKDRWFGLAPPTHFHIFPEHILRHCAELVGFEVETIRSCSRMASSVYMQSKEISPSGNNHSVLVWLHRMTGLVFSTIECTIINILGLSYGEELLLIGHKTEKYGSFVNNDTQVSKLSLKATNVASVTVSYNNKLTLKKHIESLLAQTCSLKEIIVVDNASTDGTQEMISALFGERITFIPLLTNTGVAGGLTVGLKHAFKKGYDWFWIFDQDSVPVPSALEALIKVQRILQPTDPIGILASLPICNETGVIYEGWSWHDRIRKIPSSWQSQPVYFVDTVISSGSMIRREVIREVGYPREEYFIDFVDHEYNLRVRKKGFRIAVVTNSIIHHSIGNPKIVARLGNQRIRLRHPPWREYYKSRNETYTIWYHIPGWRAKIFSFAILLRRIFGIAIYDDKRVQRLKMILLGFWHGIKGSLGRRVFPHP